MSYEGVRQTDDSQGSRMSCLEGANNVEVLQPEDHRAVCTLCVQFLLHTDRWLLPQCEHLGLVRAVVGEAVPR